MEVVILQYWMEARLRIEKIDEQEHIVTFTGSSWRPLDWTFGYYVENVAEQFAISRKDQDAFALRSQQKAAAAQKAGRFAQEITAIEIPRRKQEPLIFMVRNTIYQRQLVGTTITGYGGLERGPGR